MTKDEYLDADRLLSKLKWWNDSDRKTIPGNGWFARQLYFSEYKIRKLMKILQDCGAIHIEVRSTERMYLGKNNDKYNGQYVSERRLKVEDTSETILWDYAHHGKLKTIDPIIQPYYRQPDKIILTREMITAAMTKKGGIRIKQLQYLNETKGSGWKDRLTGRWVYPYEYEVFKELGR